MSFSTESGELSQQQLWETMHAQRDPNGNLVGRSLVDKPNNMAIMLGEQLSTGSRVLEMGCANGRDARYLALSKGAIVRALDFSQAALDQLRELADDQGIGHLVTTELFDATTDTLTVEPASLNAFYARSSLHVGDARLSYLLGVIHDGLAPDGLVAIEGKHSDDPKIARSEPLDPSEPHLVSDPYENGHVRRFWDIQFTANLMAECGFEVVELDVLQDQTEGAELSVFTRVLAVKS